MDWDTSDDLKSHFEKWTGGWGVCIVYACSSRRCPFIFFLFEADV